jgi:hypothetical protein
MLQMHWVLNVTIKKSWCSKVVKINNLNLKDKSIVIYCHRFKRQ